jgi:hypothetical protein
MIWPLLLSMTLAAMMGPDLLLRAVLASYAPLNARWTMPNEPVHGVFVHVLGLPLPPEAPLGGAPNCWLQPRLNVTGPSGLSFPTFTLDDVHVVFTHDTTSHGEVVCAVEPVQVIVGDWPATVSVRPTFCELPLHTAGDAKRTVALSCT